MGTTNGLVTTNPSPLPRAAWGAMRTGDAKALATALLEDERERGGDELLETRVALRGAQLAIELRRESVAVIGNHEAFVRRTPAGHLHQVVRPVVLSVAEGTLYQVPTWKKVKKGTKEIAGRSYEGQTEWVDIAKHEGMVTFAGYNAQNAVVGAHIGLPRTVNVDGEERTNPFVHRALSANGRLGDIMRVVIAVVVVAPAPATGNPTVVHYVLDYDPAKDLQHMLASIAEDKENESECYLIHEDEWTAMKRQERAGWAFTPVHGGVGYAYRLSNPAIREAYSAFVNLAQNAVKKAQTVARRNAMRSHPAFVAKVTVDNAGVAKIPVVGWAADESSMRRWQEIQAAMARGGAIDDLRTLDADVIADQTVYEPARDDDDAARPTAAPDGADDEPAIDPKVAEKNLLIDRIDDGLALLSADQVARLGYDPAAQSADDLREVLTKMNAMIDGGNA